MTFEERLRAAHRREMELLRELTAETGKTPTFYEEGLRVDIDDNTTLAQLSEHLELLGFPEMTLRKFGSAYQASLQPRGWYSADTPVKAIIFAVEAAHADRRESVRRMLAEAKDARIERRLKDESRCRDD